MSILHDAIRNGTDTKSFAKLLKKKSVSVNHQDPDTLQSPLHVACTEGKYDLVKCLLKAGGSANLRDSSGWTPLHCACKYGYVRVCEILLQQKQIDSTILTIEKTSALYYLARKVPKADEAEIFMNVLSKLTSNADMKQRNAHGECAIHSACMGGNAKAILFLLERGASPNEVTTYGETPLHYATRVGRLDIIEMLIERGADPSAMSQAGQTPIDIARQFKMQDIVDEMEKAVREAAPDSARKPRMSEMRMDSQKVLPTSSDSEKKLNRSKSEVFKNTFKKTLSSPLARTLTREPSDLTVKDRKEETEGLAESRNKNRSSFSRRLFTNILSTDTHKSNAAYIPGMKVTEIPEVDILKQGNFPLWDPPAGDFLTSGSIIMTAKSVLMFQSPVGTPSLKYSVLRPLLRVRKLSFPIAGQQHILDFLFLFLEQPTYMRIACPSDEILFEWVFTLSADHKSPFALPLAIQNITELMFHERLPIIFNEVTVGQSKLGGVTEDESLRIQFLFELVHMNQTEDRASLRKNFLVNPESNEVKSESLATLRLVFSMAGDSPFAHWILARELSKMTKSNSLILGLLQLTWAPKVEEALTVGLSEDSIPGSKSQMMSSSAPSSLVKLLDPKKNSVQVAYGSSSSLKSPRRPGASAPSAEAILERADFGLMLYLNYLMHNNEIRKYLREVLGFVVDTLKDSPEAELTCTEEDRIMKVLAIGDQVIDKILCHIESTPIILRQFISLVHSWVSESSLLEFSVVSLLFFKLFIGTSILRPYEFCLLPSPPSDGLAECLFQLTRLFFGLCSDEGHIFTWISGFAQEHESKVKEINSKLVAKVKLDASSNVRFLNGFDLDADLIDKFFLFLEKQLKMPILPILTIPKRATDEVPSLADAPDDRLTVLTSQAKGDVKLVKQHSAKRLVRVRTKSEANLDVINQGMFEGEGANRRLTRTVSTNMTCQKPLSSPPLSSRKSRDSKEEGSSKSPDQGSYKFFFHTKIKPLKDIWPSKPPELKKWPKDTSNLPDNWVVLYGESLQMFDCEWGSSETLISSESEFEIEYLDTMTTRFFKDHLMQEKHYNYITIDEALGPIVGTVEAPAKVHGDQVKVILRYCTGDDRLFAVNPLGFRGSRTRSRSFSGAVPSKIIKRDFACRILASIPSLENTKFTKVDDPKFDEKLVKFEHENCISHSFKFGVLSIKPGEKEEDQWYSNNGCPDFFEFMDFIAKRVELKNWKKFRGGLDVKTNTTGTHSYHREHRGFEVMFHVAPMLPYNPDDPQQLERKRHLGNDVVVLCFLEGDTQIDLSVVKSHFNHMFCVVQKNTQKSTPELVQYNVMFAYNKKVLPFTPFLPKNWTIPRNELGREFLLTKLINGEQAALLAPVFKEKAKRTRNVILTDMVETALKEAN